MPTIQLIFIYENTQILLINSLTLAAEVHILLVVGDSDKKHFLLLAALTYSRDVLLGFELLTARPATKHRDTTLRAHAAIKVGY